MDHQPGCVPVAVVTRTITTHDGRRIVVSRCLGCGVVTRRPAEPVVPTGRRETKGIFPRFHADQWGP